jgi:PEP-CTERM motif
MFFAAFCLLVTVPAWGQGVCYTAGNQLVNCGFETGDFTGWTQSGNLGFTGVTGGIYTHGGNFGAYLGPVGSDGYLSQNVGAAGQTEYWVSFWLENLYSGGPNDFTVYWNGVDVGPDLVDANSFPYTMAFGVLAGNPCAGCNTITFAFRNDPSYFGLDDAFVGTPEPGSLILFGTGILGLASVIRRKMGV